MEWGCICAAGVLWTALLGTGEGLGLPAVSGKGSGLVLTGGFGELAERRADMAAAYEDDMFNPRLRSQARVTAAALGESFKRKVCAYFQK